MSREIKFRGFALRNRYNMSNYPDIKEGECVFGYLVKSRGDYYILQDYNDSGYDERWETGSWIEVDPETAGEYTGLKDKNGIGIYESDWCRACFRDKEGFHYVQGTIFMDEYMWCLQSQTIICPDEIFSINRLHDWEVLGNIYENPELLNQ